MGASGDDVLVEGNEVAYNLFNGTLMGWEGGVSKFSLTNRLVLRNNCVHHNNGPGLWTDTKNINTLIENNTVFENQEAGIFHEISYDAMIRGNIVGNNARDGKRWLYGTQILISSSRNVVVSENYVHVPVNANGISVLWQNRGADFSRVNNQVRGNTIVYLTDSGLTGAAIDFNPGVPFFSTLSFDNNTYIVPDGSSRRWAFNGGNRTWSEFQAAGQESGGKLEVLTMPEWNWSRP